ncbi:hypothetical protein [Flavobacterium undicola]|uniref:hypothetical protein n=1 Tax=Flavobacterium undicola TaxID=1932779 RepID=UPI0013789E61|nr:hypothetical protein [Flavobacterium undicola]MBA0885342.1 hypothetical protein [Flavobacterium undicola]
MKLNNFLAFLILVTNGILAQSNTTAKINAVAKNGLHKISLAAEIRSFSKEDLSDFRILDGKGIEVPYYILQGNKESTSSLFSEFKILSRTAIPKKKTTIIFENDKTSISEIVLSISNSDVKKPYSISGSNDQKEWFGLVNKAVLNELENIEDVIIFKTIPLPLSSYRYLKIDLNDSITLPINILKIGLFTHKTNAAELVEIKTKSIKTMQIHAQKKTLIHVAFKYPQIVNQINFTVSDPNLFQRNARIYINNKTVIKHKTKTYQETLSNFELNSNQKNSFTVQQLFEKDFFIEIENHDNQPLTFAKIHFFQNPITIIADLKANENYSIQTGNPKLNRPEYDLENFKNNINTYLPETTIHDIDHLTAKKNKIKNQSFWQQAWFMWLCIGLGGIAIVFFTANLVKDMKKHS